MFAVVYDDDHINYVVTVPRSMYILKNKQLRNLIQSISNFSRNMALDFSRN